jgi:hypothetical protein
MATRFVNWVVRGCCFFFQIRRLKDTTLSIERKRIQKNKTSQSEIVVESRAGGASKPAGYHQAPATAVLSRLATKTKKSQQEEGENNRSKQPTTTKHTKKSTST